jgi:hypothetical protein
MAPKRRQMAPPPQEPNADEADAVDVPLVSRRALEKVHNDFSHKLLACTDEAELGAALVSS